MIKILILDDNDSKVERIKEVITQNAEIDAHDVDIAFDLITARDLCRSKLYDLLILDLRLPNRKGDAPDDTAGCEFIKELNASTTLLKPYHIIGLTAYEDVLSKVDTFFAGELWCAIKFDPRATGWRRQISSKLLYLISSKRALKEGSGDLFTYDLAVITALQNPELQSILDLENSWTQTQLPHDSSIYYTGQFVGTTKKLSVVAACAHQMGMSAAAVLATKLIYGFRPRYLAMTGVAAGVKGGDAKLGDILIADQSWDYESGKHKTIAGEQVFEPEPRSIPLRVDIKERILQAVGGKKYVHEIENAWRGVKPSSPLLAHIGPVASGAAVIQDEQVVTHIKAQNRKLIGIDMETYGVFYAAENCSLPRPTPIVMKSVCDFADPQKSAEHQAYAAYTSARYLRSFALDVI